MTFIKPGMDHDLYPYMPVVKREALRWPHGKRVAVCVFLYFETWELDPPATALADPTFAGYLGALRPNYFGYSAYEYGNRVGIFRVLDLLDRYGACVTVAANAGACERYPYLVAEFRKRGFELAGHGSYATRMISSAMSEHEERAEIFNALDTVQDITGERPTGWISQGYGESRRTPQLLAEAGLAYAADWGNDDRPYHLSTRPPLCSIPNQAEWDDVHLLWHRRLSLSVYTQSAIEAFNRLRDEGGSSGTFFGLHLHPWLIGMPHRIQALAEILERLSTEPDVWRATAGEVCRAYAPAD